MSNKDFVEMMLKKVKEKDKTEVKDPFSNLKTEEIEELTKEVLERKKKSP